jgi:DNA-binding MarR family transcriptional regulator
MKPRKRNSCLAAIEHMRRCCGDIRLNEAIAFLYVCENEGVNIRELAQLTRLTPSSASRTARRLASKDSPNALAPSLGLVDLRVQATDHRGRILTLTATGRRLQEELNRLIVAATPIFSLDA